MLAFVKENTRPVQTLIAPAHGVSNVLKFFEKVVADVLCHVVPFLHLVLFAAFLRIQRHLMQRLHSIFNFFQLLGRRLGQLFLVLKVDRWNFLPLDDLLLL